MTTDLTDEQIIRQAQNVGFDDLAIHYETEKLTAFARAIIAADRAQRDAAPRPERKPIPSITLMNAWQDDPEVRDGIGNYIAGARFAEHLHGIKETP